LSEALQDGKGTPPLMKKSDKETELHDRTTTIPGNPRLPLDRAQVQPQKVTQKQPKN